MVRSITTLSAPQDPPQDPQHADGSPRDLREYTPAEKHAFAWARANQGFAGTFEEWTTLDDDERGAFERGAAGIPTA
jgi:hypothetical protein